MVVVGFAVKTRFLRAKNWTEDAVDLFGFSVVDDKSFLKISSLEFKLLSMLSSYSSLSKLLLFLCSGSELRYSAKASRISFT